MAKSETALKSVPSEVPDPPYPADTRTSGWHFRLDCHRVLQSNTWALAIASQWPEARPWLLMMWFVSWQELPAGSLPNDDQIIAAKLGMSDEMFAGHRSILMRGWYRATDGRLYNKTIAELVLDVISYRVGGAQRVREHRAKRRDVTPCNTLQHVTVTPCNGIEVAVAVEGEVIEGSSNTLVAPAAAPRSPTGRKTSPERKSTRLQEDWRIPESWVEWTTSAYPDLDRQKVIRMSLEFRDFWIAVPGSKGRKVNWLATWRNRVRTKMGDT